MVLKNYLASFKGRLTLLVIAAILLPLVAVSLILGGILRERIYVSFEEQLRASLQSTSLILNRAQEDLIKGVERVAKDNVLETTLVLENAEAIDEMLSQQRKVLDISMLAVFDLDQQRIASSKFKSKRLVFDHTKSRELQIAKNEDAEHYLIYSAPIEKKKKPLGSIVGGIQLDDDKLTQFISETFHAESMFWLDDRLILSSLVSAAQYQVRPPPLARMHAFRIAGKEYKGLLQSLPLGEHHFKYGLLLPMAELEQALRKTFGVIAIIGTALFIVLLALLGFILRRISRPLNTLTGHARQLVSHDFMPQADAGLRELAAASQDEIGKLAESFIDMESRLHIYLNELTVKTKAEEKIQSDLRIAHEIQMSMLPKQTPAPAANSRFDIHAEIAPAHEVGGDFYDYFMIDDRYLCVVIGDVSDKGVPASLFMAMSKTLIHATTTLTRALAQTGVPPHEILNRVNRELQRDNERRMFVTVFYGVLDTQTGELHYSNAGHHPPYLVSPDRQVTPLAILGGGPLGIKSEARFQSARLTLSPRHVLFLYTDGITEAMNPQEEFFSEHRLQTCLAAMNGAAAQEMTQQVLREVKAFVGAAPPHDDMTVLALCFL